MSKAGDNLKFWLRNKHKVFQQLEERGIFGCEIRLDNKCTGGLFTTPAHRHKRHWYINTPELLIDLDHVIVACENCHTKIEPNRVLTEEVFQRLRPIL